MNNPMLPVKIKHARIIGCLFLSAFIAYGFGRYYFSSEESYLKWTGASLILINSVIVLFIGILLRKTLQQYRVWVGNVYLYTRIFEAIALSALVLTLLPTVTFPKDYDYFLAMLVLGLGSIPMCLTIYKDRIVPPWLGLWGVVGYAIFAFGFLMELVGIAWSMNLLILAGLWEITFGIWLIIKGGKSVEAN